MPLCLFFFCKSGGDETEEEGVRLVGAALELGVELHTDEVVVFGNLYGFDNAAVRRGAADAEPCIGQCCAELVVELVAVAVPLGNLGRAVGTRTCCVSRLAILQGYAPRRSVPPLAISSFWSGIKSMTLCVDCGVKFAGVARPAMPQTWRANSIDGNLHAEAYAEDRARLCVAAVVRGRDHALDAAIAEAAGDDHARAACREFRRQLSSVQRLGVDPLDFDMRAVRIAGVAQRLCHREIGVVQLDILADKADVHGLSRRFRCASSISFQSVRSHVGASIAQLTADDRRRSCVFSSISGASYSTGRVMILDHAVRLDIAEQCEILRKIVGFKRLVAAER